MVETKIGATGQQGFTLIEIIAVLVILGILAIVAVPKYYDLQSQARQSAAKGLIAAAQSQLSMGYAIYKLNSSWTNTPATECTKVAVSGGSGNVYCGTGNWDENILITANVDGGSSSTGYWNTPEK
ncbi:MAG: type II secretion system protein [Solidesulfovibrio sp. DCME]|uniref:type II secretion system protein n=1 Tax=Solidesulfovibrio sp. DCME TaxID=3447380 RepID=UPI003D0FB716